MSDSYKIAIISPHFPPAKTSTANQINALARKLSAIHKVSVITYHTEGPHISHRYLAPNLYLCSIRSSHLFSNSVLIRFIIEFIQPWLSLFLLLFFNTRVLFGDYDYVLIWSPPVLNVPLAWIVSILNRARMILLHRDVFPQWALDVGLIKSTLVFRVLSAFEHIQYLMSDLICTQSSSNIRFITRHIGVDSGKVVCLPNWNDDEVADRTYLPSSLQKLINSDKRIILYAGTLGPAQGTNVLQSLLLATKEDDSLSYIILGKGSGISELNSFINKNYIENVYIHSQIPESQLIVLQNFCDFGLILLNPLHTTTNIPGKYISYLRSGLPVVAFLNSSNSLVDEINHNRLGRATSATCLSDIIPFFYQTLSDSYDVTSIRQFFISNYSTASVMHRLLSFVRRFE